MLTQFGKEIRKLRIDHGWLLKDMADGVGVTPSFLSAVETGKKPVPDDLIDKIARWARLAAADVQGLRRAADLSVREARFRIREDAPIAEREVVALLARTFEKGASADFLERVRKLLEDRKK